MSVATKKLEGVESVEVSLEKASAEITLKPDNKLTVAELRRIIRSTGYVTKDAAITARGRVIDRAGKPALDLLNGDVMELAERPKDAPAASVTVEVTGVSRAKEDNSEVLTIRTIKP